MPRPAAGRSLAQQAFALRASFPGERLELSAHTLAWSGAITPTALSRTYRVTITYQVTYYPKVRVIAPELEARPGEPIPHLFNTGNLCLYLEDEWSSDMLIVDTTVPWTSEWLLHYEIWRATGTWNGGGEWPPRRQANSDSTSNMSRSARRRAARRRPR
jgi:hypothetical protein